MSNRILSDYSYVNLIILLGNNSPEHTDSFDYLISAQWLNELRQDEGMDIVLDYFFDVLNEDERAHISRITIVHSTDPFVRNITSGMNISGGSVEIINCQFNNIVIPYAILLESKFN